MVGVAGGILAIILFTGNHDPAPPRNAAASGVAALAPNPEQLRTYQRRLEAADTRPQAPPCSTLLSRDLPFWSRYPRNRYCAFGPVAS